MGVQLGCPIVGGKPCINCTVNTCTGGHGDIPTVMQFFEQLGCTTFKIYFNLSAEQMELVFLDEDLRTYERVCTYFCGHGAEGEGKEFVCPETGEKKKGYEGIAYQGSDYEMFGEKYITTYLCYKPKLKTLKSGKERTNVMRVLSFNQCCRCVDNNMEPRKIHENYIYYESTPYTKINAACKGNATYTFLKEQRQNNNVENRTAVLPTMFNRLLKEVKLNPTKIRPADLIDLNLWTTLNEAYQAESKKTNTADHINIEAKINNLSITKDCGFVTYPSRTWTNEFTVANTQGQIAANAIRTASKHFGGVTFKNSAPIPVPDNNTRGNDTIDNTTTAVDENQSARQSSLPRGTISRENFMAAVEKTLDNVLKMIEEGNFD